MDKKNEIVLVDEKYLENKIYIIRGQKVMLDRDLAEIYGYTTKAFNQQIKNNINKFKDDFMFQLTEEETTFYIRSKKLTGLHRNERFKPYAFTESGIYMLMTVLKGSLATKQSIALIRLFRSMKDYLIENKTLLPSKELELRTTILEKDVKDIKHDNKDIRMDLKKVMNYFIDPNTYKHFLILNGKKLEADIAYKNIFKLAKKSIIYIDNYVGLKTLELLSYASKGVSIIIFSDNKAKPPLTKSMIDDFNTQNITNKLSLYKPSIKFHDRYIIIDHNTKNETIFHCGSSLKDSGFKISTITKLEMPNLYKPIINNLLKSKDFL